MKKILPLLFFVYLFNLSFAQPGGGGDLIITTILDEDGWPILADDEAFDFAILPSNVKSDFRAYPYNLSYIPTKDSVPRQVSFVLNRYFSNLLVIKGDEIMLLEFIDMLGENGGGADDYLSSIPFIPGYHLTISRGFQNGGRPVRPDIDPDWLGSKDSKRQFNKKIEGLVNKTTLSNNEKARLIEKSVAKTHHQSILYNQVLRRFDKSIELSQWVLSNTQDSITRMNAIGNIFYCYISLGKTNEARIQYLQNKNDLKKLLGGSPLIYFLEELGLQQEVLEVHNELCAQSDYSWYWYHRGYFKLNELNNPVGAIPDFDFALQKCVPISLHKADIFEYCEFSRAYFQKGLAQLKVNQIDMGAENLLNSTCYYINTTQLPSYVKSIDSLLVIHPLHSIIQLTAALLYSKSAVEQPINSTLHNQHIARAQQALTKVKDGESIFLWWMARANLQRAMMKPYDAILSTEEALKIAPDAKSAYRMQYIIYSTQLSSESALLKEAYKKWTSDTK